MPNIHDDDELNETFRNVLPFMWSETMFKRIPGYMRGGFLRWILYGIAPGHFLSAVIRNDLSAAVARADDANQPK